MAHAILRPTLIRLLELAFAGESTDVHIEEVKVDAASTLVGSPYVIERGEYKNFAGNQACFCRVCKCFLTRHVKAVKIEYLKDSLHPNRKSSRRRAQGKPARERTGCMTRRA
jgi:hypothetical protein